MIDIDLQMNPALSTLPIIQNFLDQMIQAIINIKCPKLKGSLTKWLYLIVNWTLM